MIGHLGELKVIKLVIWFHALIHTKDHHVKCRDLGIPKDLMTIIFLAMVIILGEQAVLIHIALGLDCISSWDSALKMGLLSPLSHLQLLSSCLDKLEQVGSFSFHLPDVSVGQDARAIL